MIHWYIVIHLYKADLGILLGVKQGKFTFLFFKKWYLDSGLFDMVPSKICQDTVILLVLQYTISWLTPKYFAEEKGDAAVCLDSIIQCMTSCINQLRGISIIYVFFMPRH